MSRYKKKPKYTKVELLHLAHNVADINVHSSLKKMKKLNRTEDDIMAGRLKTAEGVRKRFR